jgi:hypothetical protein
MIRAVVNVPRRFFLRRVRKDIKHVIEHIETGLTDDFLELLLDMMRLVFCINIKHYRKNIEGFRATYNFVSQDGRIAAAAVFANNKMKMKKEKVPDDDPDLKVTIIFKDGHALWKLLMSGTPDVFNSLLARELNYSGNLNYLLKFAYMSLHLKTMFSL